MSKEYKEWLSEQTFETLASDNYNIKLLLLKEQAKNKKLIDKLEFIRTKYEPYISYLQIVEDIAKALGEVNNEK